jgi:WD40 repeat protein
MWADDHPPTQLSVSPAGTTLFLTNVGDLGSGFRSTRQYAGNRLAPGPDNRVAGPRGFDGMRFTPDGALVVTSEGPNRRVTLWDVAGARLVCELTMPDAQASYRARPAPDGRTVAVCEADGVGLYEIMGLARRSVGIAPDGAVESMAVSPDGIVMDVVAWEGGVLPVHAYHWRLPERPSPLPGDAVPFPDDTPPCHSDLNIHGERAVSISGRVSRLDHQVFGSMPCEPVGGLRFAQNGDIWVTTGHVVRSFNIHDKKSRLIVANDFTAANRGSVFTALAVGGRVAVAGRRDGTLFRVITAGGDPAREQLSDAAVTALALSKDERTVAAGSAAGEVRILADGAPPVVVTGAHGHEVTTAAFGPGYLATGSEDGTVRLWLPSGQLILTLRFGGGVRKVMLPAQGRFLYVHVNGERGVRRWDMAELHRGLAATGLDPGFPSPGG